MYVLIKLIYFFQVLVMDAGRMVEYDHPHILLQNPNGILRGMVDQTGRAMAETLSKVAKQVRNQSHLVGFLFFYYFLSSLPWILLTSGGNLEI